MELKGMFATFWTATAPFSEANESSVSRDVSFTGLLNC